MTAAILEAVPAAAGICWENRHAWTQEEVKAAAAAVGVDGWDLWRIYDHKHSYYNFVTAESLAEWAHELTAYEVKGKKTRTAKATETAQDGTAAAEGATTKADGAESVTEGDSEPQATTATATGLRMEKYSEKATVIRGYNQEQRAALLEMGGRENFRLQGGKGVIFSTRKHGDALAAWMKQQQAGEGESTAPDLSPLVEAVADLLQTFARIMQEAAKWEGVTIPAATLARWKQEATDGSTTAAARLAEVCACLGSLTPDSRQQFDGLGVIFWTLSEQLRNGNSPDTIKPATDYARAQLFDLIDKTQTENQARAIRDALDEAA
jgi:hypothetical protein